DVTVPADVGGGSTMTVSYWDGNTWETVGNKIDGTINADAGNDNALAQDGWITWSQATTEKPYLLAGYYLYFYRWTLSAKSTVPEICSMTVRADMQELKDIWDGIFRTPILVQRWDNDASAPDPKMRDYTLECAETSYSFTASDLADADSVAAMPLVSSGEAFATADYIYAMFEEPCIGFKIDIKGYNDIASDFKVYYWQAATNTWASLDVSRDTTSTSTAGGDTLTNSGYIMMDDDISA
ncbi:unnamed protein product, partial [marine sediment metagenome]